MEHELKCQPPFFQSVLDGSKSFELRRDDRGFAVGDTLWLREWTEDAGYCGREWHGTITYILRNYAGIAEDFCILGIASKHQALAAMPESYRDFHKTMVRQITEEVQDMKQTLDIIEDELNQRLRGMIRSHNIQMGRTRKLLAAIREARGKCR